MGRPAVLIDRDGTLNQDPGRRLWILSPEEFVPVGGAMEALACLTSAGWPVSVITNQSCVGRGVATREQVDAVNRECARQARAAGAAIDGFHVCPHAPDAGCTCRKPLPGLLLEAAADHGYDLFGSFVLGDSEKDLVAGRAAGATPLLVLTGKGEQSRGAHPEHQTFPSVVEAVNYVLSRRRKGE
jgi:D-glycero-D-manno-heptose 1,7-bisphosphate phosphatase